MANDGERLCPHGELPRGIEAVIFDMDGTLLDTETVHKAAMQMTARAMGLEMPDALFVSLIGIHRDANTLTLRDHFGGGFAVEAFYRAADARFDAMWRDSVPLRPGARELVAWLAARGVPMAIATSTTSPFAEQRLASAGLAHAMGAIVTSSHVRRRKPHPEPYLLAAARLGVPPARCVAIEDSPNGLAAGAAAEMATILIPDLVPLTDLTATRATCVLPNLAAARAMIEAALARD